MSIRWAGLLLAAAVLATGCATPQQPSMPLRGEALAAQGTRVGVVMTALPKPDTFFPGAGCLLCIATASLANSSLTTQVRTWPTADLTAVRDDLVKLLKARGVDAIAIAQDVDLGRLPDRAREPNRAGKDFSSLRTAHKIDKLLVVQVDALGVTRNYSAYFATGDPRATLNGTGYLVDLPTHSLEWHQPLMVSAPASGGWDEPPKYPGLANAYFQVLEMTADQLKQPFGK